MILKKIEFQNFGTYGGTQTIELESPVQDRPVTLILGLNGVGKTTLLEGIQLALYGKRSHFVQSKGISFDNYLKDKIHYGEQMDDFASVCLWFSTFHLGKKKEYVIKREWHLRQDVLDFRSVVKTDGLINLSLAESWDEFIETVVPRGISGLFFFDGEQIASLADPEESAGILRSAISSLLGLELVERLNRDLVVLRRRTLKKELPEDVSIEVGQIEEQLTSIYSEVREKEFQISSLVNNLDSAMRYVAQLEEKYRLHGGDFFERRAELTNCYSRALEARNQVLEELRAYAGSIAPVIQILPLFERLGESLRNSREILLQKEIASELETRDNWMLSTLGKVLDNNSISEIAQMLTEDRVSRLTFDENTPRRSIELKDYSVAKSHLEVAQKNLENLRNKRERAQQELDIAEGNLSVIPEKDAIEQLKNDLDLAQSQVAETQKNLDRETELLEMDQRRIEKLERSLDRLLATQAERTLLEQENVRVISYIDKARRTLDELKSIETRRHLHRISELIQDSLSQLLRKKNLVHEINIDPETFKLVLLSQTGREIIPEQLSAGERQLLAVSLLWGLARSSGGSLPVVIDTPLGRLDSAHRNLLVNRYFPHASHQVVLLSTDTEISGEQLDNLADYIGRNYVLDFDNESNSTIAKEITGGGSFA